MEKIQKALEKAREQRQQTEGEQSAAGMPRKRDSGTQSETTAGDIVYSQTRTISVSDQVLTDNRVVAGIKDHPQADVFRVLRTKILYTMRVKGYRSLCITSPSKGSGKSMIAANLAVSMAMEANQTILLVDLDLRQPALHRYFGFKAEKGLSDYLLDGVALPELLVHPSIEGLVILPMGRPVPHSSELLSTSRMVDLVEDITNRYNSRIILFDLPPLLHMDDVLTFLPHVHASLLVVEEGGNNPAQVKECLHLLEGSDFLGTVYNKAREVKHSPY